MTDLPRAAISRALRLSRLPLGVAGRTVKGVGQRLSGQDPDAVTEQQQAEAARQLFEVLGGLKGGAMKVGQFLSLMETGLPEHVAAPYRAQLTRLQDSAPALEGAAVHTVLAEHLGRQWRRKLIEFDDDAVAAASLGQVHRATWHDGRDVAVKVQYPGAEEALMADVRALNRFARIGASWMRGLDLPPLLDELTRRVREEVDYRLEGDAQAQFAQLYADDDRYAVPAVVEATQRVLVSEWIEGQPLSRLIADGTQPERDAAGASYLELLLGSPERAGLLHADPHPGNFRLLADGRLGVLDFGAVDRLPDGLPAGLTNVLRASMVADAEGLVEVLRAPHRPHHRQGRPGVGPGREDPAPPARPEPRGSVGQRPASTCRGLHLPSPTPSTGRRCATAQRETDSAPGRRGRAARTMAGAGSTDPVGPSAGPGRPGH